MLKKNWFKILCIILMFVCYGCAVSSWVKLESVTGNKISAAFLSGKMNKEAADRILQTESKQDHPIYFNLWGKKENETVNNPELGRTGTVEAVFVYNGTQLVLSGMTALDESDRNGCLIDQKTAIDLFGSINITGHKIVYKNRVLTIRQVISDENRVLILQADGEEAVFEAVSLELMNGKENVVETFLSRHGIDGRLQDFSLLVILAKAAAWILPFSIGINIFIEMIRYSMKSQMNTKGKACMAAGGILVLILLILGIFCYINIPNEMIPTKWSDFDFWSRLFEKKQEDFLFLMQTAKSQTQIRSVLAFWQSLGLSMASTILYFLGFRSSFYSK